MKEKFPLRRPLILTCWELEVLTYHISDRVDELKRMRPSSRVGIRELKKYRALQKKLWNV